MSKADYQRDENSCPIYRFCNSNLRDHGFETHRDVLLGSNGIKSHHYSQVRIESCLSQCGSSRDSGDRGMCERRPFVEVNGEIINAENTIRLTQKLVNDRLT
ncbi:MAG: hypothetical protein AABW73_04820 [Nanoarchaeota archaeon]